jgi:hypothetical protein
MAQRKRVAVGALQVGDKIVLRFADGREEAVEVARRDDAVAGSDWLAFAVPEGIVYEARTQHGQWVYVNGVEDAQAVVAFGA